MLSWQEAERVKVFGLSRMRAETLETYSALNGLRIKLTIERDALEARYGLVSKVMQLLDWADTMGYLVEEFQPCIEDATFERDWLWVRWFQPTLSGVAKVYEGTLALQAHDASFARDVLDLGLELHPPSYEALKEVSGRFVALAQDKAAALTRELKRH